ncbi:hypothetical protein D9613_007053 [Agrocybe pediades]|uniref:Uncharacterized protein n=1 Tax=Agrocybe pediades TaxID=84607 RepID=A0A8H4VIU8_9AGAR|nr:hypothetical protein D9613_007053 [Agrocybe pediades]
MASLLAPYQDAPPLPTDLNPDGKSLKNLPADKLSDAYQHFPPPIDSSNNGFDFHSKFFLSLYYMPSNKVEAQYAKDLHERIRREFPEVVLLCIASTLAHVSQLRIYKFWDKPVGPHPTAMFEVNTFTPHQTGALFSWLTVHRGTCS